jgi:hypothetical protein
VSTRARGPPPMGGRGRDGAPASIPNATLLHSASPPSIGRRSRGRTGSDRYPPLRPWPWPTSSRLLRQDLHGPCPGSPLHEPPEQGSSTSAPAPHHKVDGEGAAAHRRPRLCSRWIRRRGSLSRCRCRPQLLPLPTEEA